MKLSELNVFIGAITGHALAVIITIMCFYFLSKGMYTTESFAILSFIMGIYIPSPADVSRLLKKTPIELDVRQV